MSASSSSPGKIFVPPVRPRQASSLSICSQYVWLGSGSNGSVGASVVGGSVGGGGSVGAAVVGGSVIVSSVVAAAVSAGFSPHAKVMGISIAVTMNNAINLILKDLFDFI